MILNDTNMSVLDNKTAFPGELFTSYDATGALYYVVVIRGTFDIGDARDLIISEEQEPIEIGDLYNGEIGQSSIKYESDLAMTKPGTDIVVVGTAYAPNERPTKHMQVGIKLGLIEKWIDVFGDRWWEFLGMSPPEPFLQMPLTYERAFGGTDPVTTDDEKAEFFSLNPVGTGFRAKGDRYGLRLPNLEDPKCRISKVTDRPMPQGFGFVARD